MASPVRKRARHEPDCRSSSVKQAAPHWQITWLMKNKTQPQEKIVLFYGNSNYPEAQPIRKPWGDQAKFIKKKDSEDGVASLRCPK